MNEKEAAFELLKTTPEGALATLKEGLPFVSSVGFLSIGTGPQNKIGPIPDLKVYFLLSDLAQHTRNIKANANASLLVVQNSNDPVHEKKRLTLEGEVRRVEDSDSVGRLKAEYLKIFPRSEMFFQLADFRFYQMKVNQIHWYGGFGKAATIKW